LDGDQLHIRHGDEVAEVGGVVERMPVAYLDRGNADRHGVLFMDARSLRQYAPYCVNLLHIQQRGAGTQICAKFSKQVELALFYDATREDAMAAFAKSWRRE
jgi:hypothetical protein